MQHLLGWIRISDGGTITLPIRYAPDHEHGLELTLVNNQVTAVGEVDAL